MSTLPAVDGLLVDMAEQLRAHLNARQITDPVFVGIHTGGVWIAEALHAFNRDWSRRVLGQGAVVLLITDGLERDSDEDLGHEMERLHMSCRRLVWLNPLLRYEAFSARARGVRTMLAHVDEFRPVHSLDAMADLCLALGERGRQGDARQHG